MVIAISGDLGSGKSTVSKLLAQRLGLRRYYSGQIWRDLAQKRGLDVYQYNKLAESDASIDHEIDDYSTKLGQAEDNFIIDSRLAWHFIPNSFKIYLSVDSREAAKRILQDLREYRDNEKIYSNLDEAEAAIRQRRTSERKRYQKLYSVDLGDLDNYNLVVDTTKIPPAKVVEKIIAALPKDKD